MRLFALAGSERLGAEIASAMNVELDPLEEREFSEGEHKSRPLVSVRGEDVFVLHSLHSAVRSPAECLLRLLFYIAVCRENGAARVTAVVPYLAYMRKDQQTKARDPVTSRYVARLFDAVGTNHVVALDVHNVSAFQNAFGSSTLLNLRQVFAEQIRQLAGRDRVVILSPDSGGVRRARLLQEACFAMTGSSPDLAIMEKHRSDDTVSGDLFAGEVRDAHVVIFDDMIATGTTMVRAARACRERGARRVYAMATHALFNEHSQVLLAPEIDSVVVSNSIRLPFPTTSSGKLSVVSCAPLVAAAIQRLHGSGSIHRLLEPI